MFQLINNLILSLHNTLVNYIDVDFTLWLSWLLTPLLVTFILPVFIVLLLYITALILYIYKLHWRTLQSAYNANDRWSAARKTVSALWDAHGWIWHGYEVCNIENIPTDSPALIIYYHGAVPIDMYYLMSKVYLLQNRLVHTVADHFLFRIPGFSIIAEGMKVIPGTVQVCSEILKENNLLAIAPGGVYEAQFSQSYELMWKRRLGFAKVAIEAKVPIIPVFTENLREAFRCVSWGRKFWLKLYSLTKFPMAPIFGGFPVKMRTHVGKPIPYDPGVTPEDLQAKVSQVINSLIETHQRKPASILYALLDRIPCIRHKID
ncbi:uncharacterized protein CBL_08321 [Carabus blaptoides fortunei]